MRMARSREPRIGAYVCRRGSGDVARHAVTRIARSCGRPCAVCFTRCVDTHHGVGARPVPDAADVGAHSQATLPRSGALIASRAMFRRVGPGARICSPARPVRGPQSRDRAGMTIPPGLGCHVLGPNLNSRGAATSPPQGPGQVGTVIPVLARRWRGSGDGGRASGGGRGPRDRRAWNWVIWTRFSGTSSARRLLSAPTRSVARVCGRNRRYCTDYGDRSGAHSAQRSALCGRVRVVDERWSAYSPRVCWAGMGCAGVSTLR